MPGNPSIVHAVGWCGHGIALALASGSWVADLVTNGAPPEDLPWFRTHMPLVPGEAVRWLAFRAAVTGMAVADRWR